MPTLLCILRLGFQSLGLSHLKPNIKPSLRLSLLNVKADITIQEHACEPIFIGISGQYLKHIVSQVKAEGYHVESLSIFRYGNLKPSESIFAIERWAAESGLKVSFNYDHEICFFEKLETLELFNEYPNIR